MSGPRPVRRWGAAALSLVIVAITALALRRQAAGMDWQELDHALSGIRYAQIIAALAMTAISFAGLAQVETWAVRQHAGASVPVRRAALAGSATHAVCHVLGWHAVLGTLLRRLAYATHGVGKVQVVGILVSVGASVGAGTVALLLVALAAWHSTALLLGALTVGAALWVAIARRGSGVHAGSGWLPRLGWQLQHLGRVLPIAALEAAACVATLWLLLPSGTFASVPLFVVTCIAAQAAGVVSHAPGGIGVFEAAMLASVAPELRPGLLAAILAYRVIYGLVPFALLGLPWLVFTLASPRPASEPT